MSDLEGAITSWRRAMQHDRVASPEALDELESHLREEIDRQMRAGGSAETAFETAVEQIGHANALKYEFAKAGFAELVSAKLKDVIFTLAGIPNYSLASPMNTSNSDIEPRWATYLKGAAFLVPALFLWTLAAVFMVPKLQEICRDAGFPSATETGFWNVAHSAILATLFFREHWLLLSGAICLALALLEWRSTKWPRYRRATVGIMAFVLNSIVLISFFMMFLTALVAAPALFHHAK